VADEQDVLDFQIDCVYVFGASVAICETAPVKDPDRVWCSLQESRRHACRKNPPRNSASNL